MNTDIKLVALDLDRTTLNSESHLSEVNRQALIDAIGNGVHVCIASGRAFDTLPEDVISVPGIEYAITSNGAAIYRIAGKECLKSYVLTPESIKTILKLTENDIVTYEAFIKGQAFASTEYTAHPEKYGATEHSLNYVKKTRILKDDIVSFILEHCHELDSIDIVVGDDELKKNIMDRIRNATDEVNEEIKALGEENFFHKDYEETLVDTYGLDYEDELVVEGGVTGGADAASSEAASSEAASSEAAASEVASSAAAQ